MPSRVVVAGFVTWPSFPREVETLDEKGRKGERSDVYWKDRMTSVRRAAADMLWIKYAVRRSGRAR